MGEGSKSEGEGGDETVKLLPEADYYKTIVSGKQGFLEVLPVFHVLL